MKYNFKITFEVESNIVPKFVEFALKEVLEEAKITVIQGQAEPLQNVTVTEAKK